MILKSYIIEQNILLLDKYKSVLFYGENNGLKDDFKKKIKEQNDKAESLVFFQEEIQKNLSLLNNEIINVSLFNDKKIIFLNGITDKVFDQISKSLKKELNKTNIYIFCDTLEKKSKLRNYFEKEADLAVIPCYQDNERTLQNYINHNLKGFYGLTPEVINLIIKNSHEDRKIISSEIVKIKQFFLDKKINKEQLLELLNIKQNSNFNLLRDATLLGNKIAVNQLLGEVDFINESPFFYLNQLNSRVLKLAEIKNIELETKDVELSMELLKPKVFWKDKPIYSQQLKKWNLKMLNNALNNMLKLEKLMKSNSQIRNDIIIKSFIVQLCTQVSNVSNV